MIDTPNPAAAGDRASFADVVAALAAPRLAFPVEASDAAVLDVLGATLFCDATGRAPWPALGAIAAAVRARVAGPTPGAVIARYVDPLAL